MLSYLLHVYALRRALPYRPHFLLLCRSANFPRGCLAYFRSDAELLSFDWFQALGLKKRASLADERKPFLFCPQKKALLMGNHFLMQIVSMSFVRIQFSRVGHTALRGALPALHLDH